MASDVTPEAAAAPTRLSLEVEEAPARTLPHPTRSLCERCYEQQLLRVVPADLQERDGGVWLVKRCPTHGELAMRSWRSVEHFQLSERLRYLGQRASAEEPSADCPAACGLCQHHQSVTGVGLLEVTSRCDLGCPVCFAAAGDARSAQPSRAELRAQLATLRRANDDRGPTTLQLIGGEPTLRDDLPELIRTASEMGFGWVQLATNGLRLARDPAYVEALAAAGLRSLYLQLDSLDDRRQARLRGRSGLVAKKLSALDRAAAAGIDRNILTVVVARGVNDGELASLVELAVARREQVLGVSFQPLAPVGRFRDDDKGVRYTAGDLLADLEAQTDGKLGVADWMPWSVYTPLIRYFLQSPLEREPTAELTPDPLCGMHALLVVREDGSWEPLSAYLDPVQAAGGFARALAREVGPGGRVAGLAADPTLDLTSKRGAARQLLGGLLLGALTRAARGRPLGFLLEGLRRHGAGLLADELRLFSFLSTGRSVVLLSVMDFMDPASFDLERLRRCTVHYAHPSGGVIPFCAMNAIHRPRAQGVPLRWVGER